MCDLKQASTEGNDVRTQTTVVRSATTCEDIDTEVVRFSFHVFVDGVASSLRVGRRLLMKVATSNGDIDAFIGIERFLYRISRQQQSKSRQVQHSTAQHRNPVYLAD
ncbi:hypothetical protein PoB_002765100 [Plakobranchus ocellatus]|uniref:Uncharacterized protein n=1 Tax=Plakobranchus ocellatus TaxID=259542 RepID=A0AAV3ZZ00_9GAST|nr:hypothetical protein PoB_002765100 [Plakobranchus ocellatus]